MSLNTLKQWANVFLSKWQKNNKSQQTIKTDEAALAALPNNPYLQSKVLWNDMYGDLQVRLENSYRLLLILSVVIVFAILGFIILAGQSKVVPYVTVIHGNEVLTLDQSNHRELNALQPKLALLFTEQFIQTARAVSADRSVNARNAMTAYAMTAGAATERLKQFYRKNNANAIARQDTKEIHITSVLRTTSHTMDVRWREDWRNIRTGKLQRSRHYIAQLTYRFAPPSDHPALLRVNPLGFTLTQLSWSEDQYA